MLNVADESSKGGMGGTQEGGTPAMIRGSINHPAHYQLDNGAEIKAYEEADDE